MWAQTVPVVAEQDADPVVAQACPGGLGAYVARIGGGAAVRAGAGATLIDPVLADCGLVIEDRGVHTVASYALASLRRDHRAPIGLSLEWLDDLIDLAGRRPACALWLCVTPAIAARRAGIRDQRLPTSEQRHYLRWVDNAYASLADHDPTCGRST